MANASALARPMILALSVVLLLAGTLSGASDPAATCAASKMKAAGKKAAAKLKCHAKAVAKGEPLDGDCLAKAEDKFAAAFAKAEAKDGCATNGDAPRVEGLVDDFVTGVVGAIPGGGTEESRKCAGAKLKAAANAAKGELGCHAKGIAKSLATDPACLAKVDEKLAASFAKAEAKEGCAGSESDEEIGGRVEDLASAVRAAVVASTTTTTVSGTTSTTTTLPTSTSTTITTASTTTTSTFPVGCGNGTANSGETCDDGNNSDNDACPSDCRIDACTPIAASQRFVSVRFAPPEGGLVAGITVLVDYPEGQVDLPGNGTSFPSGTISGTPPGASVSVNDLNFNTRGHAVRITVAAGSALPPGQIMRLKFQDCTGAPAPPAQFPCAVLTASDPFTNPVAGVTCSGVVE